MGWESNSKVWEEEENLKIFRKRVVIKATGKNEISKAKVSKCNFSKIYLKNLFKMQIHHPVSLLLQPSLLCMYTGKGRQVTHAIAQLSFMKFQEKERMR